MTNPLRRLGRAALVLLHVLWGVALVLFVLSTVDRLPGRTAGGRSRQIVMAWHRRLWRVLGLRVETQGEPAPGPALLVANHVSWLDVIVISGLCPVRFVAKREVAQWPIIGWLSRRVGTLFIERGAGNGAAAVADLMTWELVAGHQVVVFPEGTSSDGTSVRRFHARLYQSAVRARCAVQAVGLRYPCGKGVNERVPFVGDDNFLTSLFRLLSEREIQVRIAFCPPVSAVGNGRRALAEYTHKQVLQAIGAETACPAGFLPEPIGAEAGDYG